jgi:hypothetical protein
LDTTHDCWTGSYSFFTIWRTEIARAAGYTLTERSEAPWPRIEFPGLQFKPENFKGDWADGPVVEDPLVYLLVHSDIDGVIHPSEGRHLAARLEQILPALSIEGPHRQAERYERFLPGLTVGRVTQDWLQDRTKRFIKGLRVAADANEDVVFF